MTCHDHNPGPGRTAAGDPQGAGLPLSTTGRTRHRRLRHLGQADRAWLHAVLRAGLVAHLGVIIDGWPMVVPTVYGFDDGTLYLHGSVASQSLNTAGAPVCVTITLTDGLVLARSVFEHTINYRSAMIYGQPRLVTDPAEKLTGLRCLTEHLAPGQWDYTSRPTARNSPPPSCWPRHWPRPRSRSAPARPTTATARTPRWAYGLANYHSPPPGSKPVPGPRPPTRHPHPSHIGARAGTQANRYPPRTAKAT
jgi:uncharacterized protein